MDIGAYRNKIVELSRPSTDIVKWMDMEFLLMQPSLGEKDDYENAMITVEGTEEKVESKGPGKIPDDKNAGQGSEIRTKVLVETEAILDAKIKMIIFCTYYPEKQSNGEYVRVWSMKDAPTIRSFASDKDGIVPTIWKVLQKMDGKAADSSKNSEATQQDSTKPGSRSDSKDQESGSARSRTTST